MATKKTSPSSRPLTSLALPLVHLFSLLLSAKSSLIEDSCRCIQAFANDYDACVTSLRSDPSGASAASASALAIIAAKQAADRFARNADLASRLATGGSATAYEKSSLGICSEAYSCGADDARRAVQAIGAGNADIALIYLENLIEGAEFCVEDFMNYDANSTVLSKENDDANGFAVR
ncbi:hypothetical protein HPP92_008157, partial [Vanilla planifolia]